MSQTETQVIIIGAGLSGLAAAHKLAKAGRNVLVLEARDRLGGRVETYRSKNDERFFVDLGASFVHGIYGNPITKLAAELKMELDIQDPRKIGSRDYKGDDLDLELRTVLGRNVYETFFDHTENSSQYQEAPSPSKSLSQAMFYEGSPLYKDLPQEAHMYARATCESFDGWTGASLDKISHKWWQWEAETEGPDAHVTNGYSQLVNWLAEGAKKAGAEIRLGEVVTAVELNGDPDDEETQVVITTRDGKTYAAPTALITLPLGVLKNSPPKFTPPLPPRRLQSIANLGFGCLNKVVLFYKDTWWQKHTENQIVFLPNPSDSNNLAPPGVSGVAPRAAFCMNLHTLSGSPGLALFFGGTAGDQMESATDDEIRAWAEKTVHQYLKVDEKTQPQKAAEVKITRWRGDEYARGTYSYIPITQDQDKLNPAVGDGLGGSPLDLMELSHTLWGRLFFAGEHTSVDHFASAHGAYLSGVREGEKIETILEAFEDMAMLAALEGSKAQ